MTPPGPRTFSRMAEIPDGRNICLFLRGQQRCPYYSPSMTQIWECRGKFQGPPYLLGESTTSSRDAPLNVRPGKSLIEYDPIAYCVPGTVKKEKVNWTWSQISGALGCVADGCKNSAVGHWVHRGLCQLIL